MIAFTGTPVSASGYLLKGTAAGRMPASDETPRGIRYIGSRWIHTATEGSGTGEVNLFQLPPGRFQLIGSNSRLVTSIFAASATIAIGNRAYTNSDTGASVAEASGAFLAATAANPSAVDAALGVVADNTEFITTTGITVFATVASGNIEAGDTIECWMAYRPVE